MKLFPNVAGGTEWHRSTSASNWARVGCGACSKVPSLHTMDEIVNLRIKGFKIRQHKIDLPNPVGR